MSEHFAVSEFACRDGTPYPAEWVADRLVPLTEVLEAIRAAWGGPLTVISGYRTAAYNEARRRQSDGVAKLSQHIQGRAADIRPTDATPERVAALHTLILGMFNLGHIAALGGLGLYRGWVHVDIRYKADGHLARWKDKTL